MAVMTVAAKSNLQADTYRRPSPAIWAAFPASLIAEKPNEYGYDLFFPGMNVPKFATTVSQMGWQTYQDTGVLIQGDPTQPGVLQWSGQDADNDCGTLTADGNVGTTAVINTPSNTSLPVLFEARIKKSTVANNAMAFFVGLTEEGMAAATNTLLATDSADLADKDYIGFHVDQAAGATVDFVYRKAGQTAQVPIAGLQTMVAATWYKFGFYFNPSAPSAQRLAVFVNNQVQTTYVTGTMISAATFPAGEELVPTVCTKVGTGSLTDTFDLGFIRLGGLLPNT